MNVNEALAAYALRKTIGDALSDEAKLDAADVRDALMGEVDAGSAATNWAGVVDGTKVATAYRSTTKGRPASTATRPVVRDQGAFSRWLVTMGTGLAQEFAAANAAEFLAYALDRREGEAIPGVGVETVDVPATPDRTDIRIRIDRKAVRRLVAEHVAELPESVAGLLEVGHGAVD